ncbi:hypothetical protein JCM5296_007347 [Sporobolomyces johnsonii]
MLAHRTIAAARTARPKRDPIRGRQSRRVPRTMPLTLFPTFSPLPLEQASLRQQFRSLHVDNTVNNNFPFKYEGAKSKTFTVGLITLVGTGASLPFLVTAYQL